MGYIKMRYKYFTNKLITIICFLCVIIIPQVALSKDHGFYPGEKMTFEIKWSFIKAGEVNLEILPHENLDGTKDFHFLYTAKTTKFVDVFYKVRDRIESYTDMDITHSLFYKSIHQGKSQKNITVEFNWIKNEAQYSNKGNKNEPIPITGDTFDPLSVFYAFRVGELDIDNELKLHITDGKRTVKAIARVIKRQKIKVKGKRYNTILIEPKMEGVGGVFKKSKNAKLKIWITDDKRRIPVRIKSKVAVGSFVADLVSYTAGTDAATNNPSN